MRLRFLLLIAISMGIVPVSFGNPLKKLGESNFIDTNVISKKAPNSLLLASESSKASSDNGFKDLFVATSIGGSNGAKLNPRAVSFVQDYIDHNGKELQSMKGWGRPYFNLIDNIFTQYGLPRELKYLAVIESQLKPSSVSWAGAVLAHGS